MLPSPMQKKESLLLESPHQLRLSLGSSVPFITADKLDFLATYNLELDEDDEEEEEEIDSTTGTKRRFRKAKGTSNGANLLKKALSPTVSASPLGSPSPQGRTAKLIGLVKPRSGSIASEWSPLSSPSKKTTGRAHSASVSIMSGNRGRSSSRSTVMAPLKDYSLGLFTSPTKTSRRGYFEEEITDDDASSLYDYPPSAIFEEEDDPQQSTTLSPPTTIESDSRTSHVKTVTPPCNIVSSLSNHDDHEMIRSTSLSGESASSSSEKELGPFTPPALPARPLIDDAYLSPSSAPALPQRPLKRGSQISLRDSMPPPTPPKDKAKELAVEVNKTEEIAVEGDRVIDISVEGDKAEEIAVAGNKAAEEIAVAGDTTKSIAVEEDVVVAEIPKSEEEVEIKKTAPEKEAVIDKKASKEESKKLAADHKAALAQEKVTKMKQESKRKQEETERKILMKSYDELEVERFLADFGKHVNSVRSSGLLVEDPANANHLPSLEDWRHSETGKLNVSGFLVTYLLSIVGYVSKGTSAHVQPSRAEDVQEAIPEEQFRIAALRANAERLYMTALPMYEGTFAKMRKVWRWESKFKSMLWSASYFVLWFRGLLLCGLFALSIWNVLIVRAFPPKPEAIRQMLREQQQRTRELQQVKKAKAEDVIEQAQEDETTTAVHVDASALKKKGKYRLAADATRKYGKAATFLTSALADVHERIKNFVMWKSVPATWRAISLLSIAMLASYLSTPWIMARLPGLALGVCLFIIAPIAEHRPEWLGVEWKNPFDFFLAGVPNDAQYAMQVLRKRAAAGEALTGDLDIADWMKAGRDDEDDEVLLIPTMPGLEGSDSAAAVSTAVNQATAAGSSSIDWKKWRTRVAKGREMAVAGSEVLSGQRALQLPRIAGSDQAVNSQEALTGKMMLGMAKGVNWGLNSIQNTSNRKLMQRRLEDGEVTSASDGVYWAVHHGSCGHVVITPDRLRFRSMFARKVGPDAKEEQVDVLNSTTGECQVSDAQAQAAYVRTLVDVKLENVIQLKKTKTVNVGIWGIDGLEVRSKGGKTFQFSSIVKRDEAFNRILALAPQYWNKM